MSKGILRTVRRNQSLQQLFHGLLCKMAEDFVIQVKL